MTLPARPWEPCIAGVHTRPQPSAHCLSEALRPSLVHGGEVRGEEGCQFQNVGDVTDYGVIFGKLHDKLDV